MKALTAEEIRKVVRGWRLSEGADLGVRGVTIDTRTAAKGDMFVAIEGGNFDGHDFLTQAADAECIGAVVRQDRPPSAELAKRFPAGIIGVMDTVRALGDLGAHNRQVIGADVVAVTGSNGKTTVKAMIHHILQKRLRGRCSPRSFNNHVGVPLTLLGANPGDDYIICEVGSNAPGEVATLGNLCQPDVAVVTCVARSHLQGFENIQRIAAEKASLLGALKPGGMGVVLADHELLRKSLRAYDRRMVWFGESSEAVLRLTGYEPRGPHQRFQFNGRLWVDLPLAGKHNAMNALAAIAVAQRFGFEQDAAAEALADFSPVDMRLQWSTAGGRTIINDTYNANPASMVAAANVLADCDGRRVLIAGDMLELGEGTESLHRETGEAVTAAGVHLVIGVGELGSILAAGARDAGAAVECFATVEDALEGVEALLGDRDTVLVKGSRGMRMERIVEKLAAGGSDAAPKKETDA
ncbi:MAG: UDP-N-acetylmuramoyl-tripeptide--D-alanyl-D-alanine ligase [Phycisphaerae bacterium]